ncbi:MAG: CNNM domain-containing protein [Pseudomonadota bacterium]|nr:CNNM domain-containing protein [Pseudomonadota bacterium]
MNELPLWILISSIVLLVLLSAFFSSSETSMMAINRYRLKHLAKENNKSAKRVTKLLRRTDRLLGVILIGNNFTHTLGTAIATVIAIRVWDESAVLAVTVFMTIIMIIFAEVMPKTIAALRPESIAFPSSYFLKPLLKILSPLVSLVSWISNGVTKLIGIDLEEAEKQLTSEELKTILESSGIPENQLNMLLGVFEMDYLSVNDVMIPKNEIEGIDINDDIEKIEKEIKNNDFSYIPFYNDNIENIVGFLGANEKAEYIGSESSDKELLKSLIVDPLYVPENTSLNNQLKNFQKEKKRVGVIVDEYGDVEGLITLRDIIQIVVGELSEDLGNTDIMPQADGTFLIDGSLMVREINRRINWELPTNGPKTLSGLLLESAQSIPEANVGISIEGYRFETILIKDNVVKLVKGLKLQTEEEEDDDD